MASAHLASAHLENERSPSWHNDFKKVNCKSARPTPPTAAPLRRGAGLRCNVVPFFPLSGSRKNGIGTYFKGENATGMRRITNFSSESSQIASEWPEFHREAKNQSFQAAISYGLYTSFFLKYCVPVRSQTTDQPKSNAGTAAPQAREFIGFPVFRHSSPLKKLCCKPRNRRGVIFGSFYLEKERLYDCIKVRLSVN